jgi:hypothetical protein
MACKHHVSHEKVVHDHAACEEGSVAFWDI